MHIDVVQSNTGTSLQPTKQLKTGDVVHGKVMASADGKVTIRTQDGSPFTAMLADGVVLKEGQQVKLVVTGQQDGKMTMQLAPQGEGMAKLAESALSGLSLPTGGKNVELATAFLRQGVSLSPELMQRAADILSQNPGLDMETAAFMAANNMDGSLAQAVQDLASRQNNISSQLATLEQILIDNGDGAQLSPLTGNESPAQPPLTSGTEDGTTQAAAGEQPQLTQPANDRSLTNHTQADGQSEQANSLPSQPQAEPALNEGMSAGIAHNNGSNPVDTSASKQTGAQNSAGDIQARSATDSPIVQDNAAALNTAVATQPDDTAQISSTGLQPDAQLAGQAGFQPGPETVKALTMFIGRDNPGAVAGLQNEGIAAAAEAMTHAAALPAEQGEAVLQAFVDSAGLSRPEAQKLLTQLRHGSQALRESVQPQADGISQLLDKLGSMFARLDKNAAKGVELKQANRLPEKLEDMRQAISGTLAVGKEAMTTTVQRALGQSKAMEQINQFVYAQIPVDLNGRKDMAELYVFKRPGKQKKIDAEQVTMVIALDTQNIGHVESLIKVDRKNVFLRFRVQEDGIANALRAGCAEAEQALASIGYSLLELRCELSEEDINILNATSTVQAEFLDVRNLDFFI